MADVAASVLLPVLIDEIRRLKELHTLAAGVTELPVKDAVVREELKKLRADFAQMKGFFVPGASTMTASSNQAAPTIQMAANKAQGGVALGQTPQSTETRPPARPRMNSVNLTGMLPLPEGCDTHFFLSHFQATGSDQVATLELELQRLGFCSWLDNKADDLTKAVRTKLSFSIDPLIVAARYRGCKRASPRRTASCSSSVKVPLPCL